MREHRSVDRIRLRELAGRLGKVTGLTGIHDSEGDERGNSLFVIGDPQSLAARPDAHV